MRAHHGTAKFATLYAELSAGHVTRRECIARALGLGVTMPVISFVLKANDAGATTLRNEKPASSDVENDDWNLGNWNQADAKKGDHVSTITSKDGTVIAFDTQGTGPALILVDGALVTRSFGSKPALVDLLAPHFTVFSYDRRGRGDSGDTLPYAVDREIEDIEALIDNAGGAAFLYGHSSGAVLALEAAERLGSNVTKLAMYEAPCNDDPEAKRAWRTYVHQLTELLEAGRHGDAVALFMSLTGARAEDIAGIRQTPFWAQLEAVAPTLAYDHVAILGEEAAVPIDLAASVNLPVLVMSGSASFPFMTDTAKALADVMPHGEFRLLEGQSHEVSPEALAPVLVDFFSANEDSHAGRSSRKAALSLP